MKTSILSLSVLASVLLFWSSTFALTEDTGDCLDLYAREIDDDLDLLPRSNDDAFGPMIQAREAAAAAAFEKELARRLAIRNARDDLTGLESRARVRITGKCTRGHLTTWDSGSGKPKPTKCAVIMPAAHSKCNTRITWPYSDKW